MSHLMGETDHDSIFWDVVAVYEPGKLWDRKPPEPTYSGGPVVDVIDEARTAITAMPMRKFITGNQSDVTANSGP